MDIGTHLRETLDVDKNGKVGLSDAIMAAENHWGPTLVRVAGGSFGAGVVITLFLTWLVMS